MPPLQFEVDVRHLMSSNVITPGYGKAPVCSGHNPRLCCRVSWLWKVV